MLLTRMKDRAQGFRHREGTSVKVRGCTGMDRSKLTEPALGRIHTIGTSAAVSDRVARELECANVVLDEWDQELSSARLRALRHESPSRTS